MQCYFIDSYVQSAFSYCATWGVHLSALAFTRMLGNYSFTYVHNSVKREPYFIHFWCPPAFAQYVGGIGTPCFIVLCFTELHRYRLFPMGGLWEACIEQVCSRHFSNSACSLWLYSRFGSSCNVSDLSSLYLLWGSAVSDLCVHCNCFGAPWTASIYDSKRNQ